MIRVHGFRTAAAKRACQHFKENAQNFCLIPFQDLIERIVPVTSIGRFIIVLTPHIQETCTLIRKLTLPWDKVGNGGQEVLPDKRPEAKEG